MLEIGLSDDDIGLGAGLDVPKVLESEDPVVARVGDVEVGRVGAEIHGDARLTRREVEFAALHQIRGAEIHGVLAEHTCGRAKCASRAR